MRKHRVAAGVTAAVFAVLYAVYALVFAIGSAQQIDYTPVTPPAGGIDVDVIPQTFDPATETMTALIRIDADPSFYGPNGTLKTGIEMAVSPTLDQNVIIFPAGSSTMSTTVRLEVEGTVRNYPFDRHTSHLTAVARALDANAIPVGDPLLMSGGLQVPDGFTQWTVTAQNVSEHATATPAIDVTFSRSTTTISFACIMIALMLALGVIVAFVTWWVVTRRRKPEFGMVTWFAALTFALITVRNNLPGAPPFGSWVDVLVFFWVEAVLLLALCIAMVYWLRDRQTEANADWQTAPGAPGWTPGSSTAQDRLRRIHRRSSI